MSDLPESFEVLEGFSESGSRVFESREDSDLEVGLGDCEFFFGESVGHCL